MGCRRGGVEAQRERGGEVLALLGDMDGAMDEICDPARAADDG